MPNKNQNTQVQEVTGVWVKDQMKDLNVSVSQIVTDTGCNQSNVSSWISGNRKMSYGIRAMFLFYFSNCRYEIFISNHAKASS